MLFAAALLVAMAVLPGCGGGGGSSADGDTLAASLPGIYDGVIDFVNSTPNGEGLVLFAPDNEVIVIVDEAGYNRGVIVYGTSNAYSGTLQLENGSDPAVTISGLRNRKEFSGETRANGSAIYFYSFERNDAISDAAANLAMVAGDWNETVGGQVTQIAVTAGGALSGNDGNGCSFGGTISLLDARYNLYRISMDATGCSAVPTENLTADQRNGTYTGLGFLEDADTANERLVLAVDNGEVPILFLLN